MLKRAIYSLRYHWKKVLAHILTYSVLFSLCFGAIMVYSTVRGQQSFLQGALQRAVTLRAGDYKVRVAKDRQGRMTTKLPHTDMEKLLQDEAIEDWNTCDTLALHIEGSKLLYPEEREKSFQEHYYGQLAYVHEDGMNAICVRDSERSQAFVTTGFQLVEGEHFSGDDPGDILMVSEDFAQLNGLRVGDTVRVSNIANDDQFAPFAAELEITGIFRAPDSTLLKGIGARPEETLVMPLALRNRLLQEPLDTYGYRYVTFYLKEGADRQAFIDRLQTDLPISQILDDYFGTYTQTLPPEAAGMDWDEAYEYITSHPAYILQLDSQWYDMVAKPLDQEAKLAEAMLYLLLGSVALIIALIVVLSVKERRREVGILLSMGESKIKVVGQLALETVLPMLISLAIGVGAGTVVGVPLAEGLCNGVYEQTAADTQSENSSVTFGYVLNYSVEPAATNERSLASILNFGDQHSLEVFPQAVVQVDMESIAAYAGLLLAAALLALLAQSVAILTAKPAKILLNRR